MAIKPTTTLPRIKDKLTSANQGIILVRQEAMQSIFAKSGPNAKSNEFQVHYWALNLRFKADDNSILDIAIPTCYFNYPQEVTSAHIDFELKDVIDVSAKVQPLHNMKMNELLATSLVSDIETLLGVKFDQLSVPYNSIHRHPGSRRSQSFSGTDLCKDPTEPGVVYPLQRAENDLPNFAGIMTIDGGICNVAHYEYRVVNGTLGTDIDYVQGGCSALISEEASNISAVENILGIPRVDPNYAIIDETVHTDVTDAIHRIFDSIDFRPSTDAINPANVTQKAYTHNHFKSNSFFGNQANKGTSKTISKKPSTDKYKDVTLHFDEKVIEKKNSKQLIALISELAKLYYTDDVMSFCDEYLEAIEEMDKPDLIAEYCFMRDSIVDEYNETQTANKDQKPLNEIINALSGFGVAKTTLLSTPEDQIREWYKNLTGE